LKFKLTNQGSAYITIQLNKPAADWIFMR